jgi:hypothetical protein
MVLAPKKKKMSTYEGAIQFRARDNKRTFPQAASSPLFRQILAHNSHKNPFIYLKGIQVKREAILVGEVARAWG